MYRGLLNCITNEEFFVYYYCMSYFINSFENREINNITDINKYLLSEIRGKLTSSELNALIINKLLNNDDDYSFYITNHIQQSLENYYEIINNPYIVDKKIDNITSKEFTFTTNALIKYVYENTIDNNFDELLIKLDNQVFNYEKNTLKLIEISVNIDSKNHIESILTEIIINIINNKNSINKIDVLIDDESITVTDYIGFDNITSFLSLLIPFFSERQGSLFKQSSYSSKIVINTSFNNISTNIEMIPLIKDNKVYDINYIIKRYNSDIKNHTSITIYLIDDMKCQLLTDSKIFINNFSKLLPDINLSLNGMENNILYETIYKTDFATVLFTTDKTVKSYVLIDGIPDKLFTDFSKQFSIYNEFIKLSYNQMIINFNRKI